MLRTPSPLARIPWLKLAALIDRLSWALSWVAAVAVFCACVLSAYNAVSSNSNAWSELNSYLFAACVLLGAAHVLRVNEHVRVDVIYSRLGGRAQVWVDLFGLTVFLLPVMLLMSWLSWPYFTQALHSGELLANAASLKRWPLLLMLPLGFGLLSLQAVSEIIKRIAWLNHRIELDLQYERPLQ